MLPRKEQISAFKVRHVTDIAQQESNSLWLSHYFLSCNYWNLMLLYFLIDDMPCRYCGLYVAAYAEFLSDGLEVPWCGISADTLRLRYASLLWNYGIIKARNDYVSNNEEPKMPRPKKSKIDENVVFTTID